MADDIPALKAQVEQLTADMVKVSQDARALVEAVESDGDVRACINAISWTLSIGHPGATLLGRLEQQRASIRGERARADRAEKELANALARVRELESATRTPTQPEART